MSKMNFLKKSLHGKSTGFPFTNLTGGSRSSFSWGHLFCELNGCVAIIYKKVLLRNLG